MRRPVLALKRGYGVPPSVGKWALENDDGRLLLNGHVVSSSANQRERGAQFLGEELRLLPGGEVTAPIDLVEVGEVGV